MFIPNADSYRNDPRSPEPPKWVGTLVPALLAGLISMGGFFAYTKMPKDMTLTQATNYINERGQLVIKDNMAILKAKLTGNVANNSDAKSNAAQQSSQTAVTLAIKSIPLDSPSLMSCAQKIQSKPDRIISRIEQSDHTTIAKTADCYLKLPQKTLCDSKTMAESQTLVALYYRTKRNQIEADKRMGTKKTSAAALWSSPLDQSVDKGFRALIAKGLIDPQESAIQAEAEMAALAKSVTPGPSVCASEEPNAAPAASAPVPKKPKRAA